MSLASALPLCSERFSRAAPNTEYPRKGSRRNPAQGSMLWNLTAKNAKVPRNTARKKLALSGRDPVHVRAELR